MKGWRRTNSTVGVMSPQGLLAPDWLVGEERPMEVLCCAAPGWVSSCERPSAILNTKQMS